jgi:hypothetical protein
MIELKEKAMDRNRDFDPVKLEDGTELFFSQRSDSSGNVVRCISKRDGKDTGLCSWNTQTGRMSARIEPLNENTISIMRAMIDGVEQILNDK